MVRIGKHNVTSGYYWNDLGMRKIILFLLSFMLITVMSQAAFIEEWNTTFGGNKDDCAYSVQQTSDGGYILAGNTYSDGTASYDAWLIKISNSGNHQWSKTFGGKGGDYAYSVQKTLDGGYILAGETHSYGAGNADGWLIKTDSNGNKQWNKTVGGISSDYTWCVQQTSDGYILAGYTNSYGAGGYDAWLIKTDSNGNQKWNKTFGGTDDDSAHSIQQTSDGGYVLAGDTKSYGTGNTDAWLIKTDSNGNEQWNKTFGGTVDDNAFSVNQTLDGGYVLTGSTSSYGAGSYDAWLVKTDRFGNHQWNKTFGGIANEGTHSVQQTSDGGYILTGWTESYGAGYSDVSLIKTDSSGNQKWNYTLGGTNYDVAYSVQQAYDGGYILTGYTRSYGAGNSDAWLIKMGYQDLDIHLAGSYNTGGYVNSVVVAGNYAYLTDHDTGLVIVDVSNPNLPVLKSMYTTSGGPCDVAVAGDYAYVADGYNGLIIANITNPASPTLKGICDTAGYARGIAVSGNHAYIASGESGLIIVDVTNPAAPIIKGDYETGGWANDVAIAGNYAYVADSEGGLNIIDITDAASPIFKGICSTGQASGVVISENYAYVANGPDGLAIVDITNPVSPTLKSSYSNDDYAEGIAVANNYAYIANSGNGIFIVNISKPSLPSFEGSYDTNGEAVDVAVSGNYVYVADGNNGLVILRTDLHNQDWNPWNDPDSLDGESIALSELMIAIYDWRFGVTLSTGEMVNLSRLQGLIYSWRFG